MRLASTGRSHGQRIIGPIEAHAEPIPAGLIITLHDSGPGFLADIRLTLAQLEKLTAAARDMADAPTVVLPAGN